MDMLSHVASLAHPFLAQTDPDLAAHAASYLDGVDTRARKQDPDHETELSNRFIAAIGAQVGQFVFQIIKCDAWSSAPY